MKKMKIFFIKINEKSNIPHENIYCGDREKYIIYLLLKVFLENKYA